MIKPKKSLGQNFLTDKRVIKKILKISRPENSIHILEVGPGTGNLTKYLIDSGAKITAVEKDDNLCKILKEKFSQYNNFTIYNEDILKFDFSENNLNPYPIKVIANLPYNISSQILIKFTLYSNFFTEIYITMQKEVVDRITAKVKTKNYGLLTPFVQLFYECKKEFLITPSAFSQKPKIYSAFMSLKLKNKSLNIDKISYFKFLKLCFSMKRKFLSNNLKKKFSEEKIEKVYKEENLEKNIRPEEISPEKYLNLYRRLSI